MVWVLAYLGAWALAGRKSRCRRVVACLTLGGSVLLSLPGCGSDPPTAPPSPERTPWLFPDKQIELLKSSDERAQMMAARNLGNMGATAKDAIPELEKLSDAENPKVREMVAEALRKIRAASEED